MLPIKERARALVDQMKVIGIGETELPDSKAAFIYGVIPKETRCYNIKCEINYDSALLERFLNGGMGMELPKSLKIKML